MDYWYYLLNNLANHLHSCLHMRNNLWYFFIANNLHYFLYQLRNCHDFFPFYYFFNYLLYNNLNWFENLFLRFQIANNFFDYLHWFYFFLNNYSLFLDNDWFLYLDHLLHSYLFRLQLCFFTYLYGHSLIDLWVWHDFFSVWNKLYWFLAIKRYWPIHLYY